MPPEPLLRRNGQAHLKSKVETMSQEPPSTRVPEPLSLTEAIIPIAALVLLLGLSYYLFGDEAAAGPNQIALMFSTVVASFVAVRRGHDFDSLRDAAVASVTAGLSAIFILLAVGSLIGTWALSGTLIAMVYYGLQLLSPDYFYVTTMLICAVVALSIGSSWTVAGTIGIGLIGIAREMDLDPAITAGAVISGAYFGDKSSPLSDATNLACVAAGAKLYAHVKEALWTSVPALAGAMVLFWLLGEPREYDASVASAGIEAAFNISLLSFLPLVLVLTLAILRYPPFVTIFLGALAGALLAVVAAPDRVIAFASAPDLAPGFALLKGVWSALATGYVSDIGDPEIDRLLSRGGMESMLGTIWLILAALAFGGVVEKAGVIDKLFSPIIRAAKSTGALISTLVAAALSANVLAADQYIAIVLPGRMFQKVFHDRKLQPLVLSRAIGDSATVTSALIPWNSCGAYMAATLGIATVSFAPYCFFNILNPLVTILFGFLGIRMLRTGENATTKPSTPA